MAENINNNNNNNGNNSFKNTVRTLVDGMDSFISAKTVLGDPVTIGDTTVIPLVDVSFGVGAGAFGKSTNGNSGGGMLDQASASAPVATVPSDAQATTENTDAAAQPATEAQPAPAAEPANDAPAAAPAPASDPAPAADAPAQNAQ